MLQSDLLYSTVLIRHALSPFPDGANGGGGAAKPSSAGATREASMRVLQLCQKGEWPPMDQVLKGLEKTVAAGGDDVNPTPLAGIMDPVSTYKHIPRSPEWLNLRHRTDQKAQKCSPPRRKMVVKIWTELGSKAKATIPGKRILVVNV